MKNQHSATTASPAAGTTTAHESARAQIAGAATYIDDLPELRGTLHAAPILSTHAHGHLRGVDPQAALAMPGVVGVVLSKDIPGDPMLAAFAGDEPVFAINTVEHVGQVIGLVVARSVMQADEVLAWIVVPKATLTQKNQHHACKVYKISKRFEDDISAVCLALDIHTEKGVVTHASIGVGGVAATPVRARATEKTLLGKPWNTATVQEAMHCLRSEFTPISDMRASSHYRQDVLGNLLWRFWLESQGQAQMDLQTLQPLGLQWEPVGASA